MIRAGDGRPPGGGHRNLTRWLVLPLLALVTSCTAPGDGAQPLDAAQPGDTAQSSPFAGCEALTAPPAPPASAPVSGAASAPVSGAVPPPVSGAAIVADLPDLTMPCFTGGQPVRLADLRGPAVLNLWGSWCPPCRAELPAIQRLADRSAGTLHVVGVDSGDSRESAASLGTDLGLSFANLYDRPETLKGTLKVVGLPATVFIDRAGKRHVYNGPPLDYSTLVSLVERHAGVRVPA